MQLALAPAGGSTLAPSFSLLLAINPLRLFRVDRRVCPVRHCYQVVGSVVSAVAVYVMDHLASSERSSMRLLPNHTVLSDVALRVCPRMLRHVQEHVALPQGPAPAPFVALGSSASWPVAMQVAHGMAGHVAVSPAPCSRDRSLLTAATHAEPTRVRRLASQAQRLMHSVRRRRSRPVTLAEAFSWRSPLTASTEAYPLDRHGGLR